MVLRFNKFSLLASTAAFGSFFLFTFHTDSSRWHSRFRSRLRLPLIWMLSLMRPLKRMIRLLIHLAGTSVVSREEFKRFQPSSPAEMLLSVPGINVQEDSDDPGSSINIRGLQDFGRVNVMIDGARQNFQRSGP